MFVSIQMELHPYHSQAQNNDTDDEAYVLAQTRLTTPKVLCDLILVLVPAETLLALPSSQTLQRYQQSAFDAWHPQARYEDECLRIDRRWIPHRYIYLPDTEAGRSFQKIATLVGNVPINANVIPENKNQGYWLRTQHYVYQAQGLVIANALHPVLQGEQCPRTVIRGMIGAAEGNQLITAGTTQTALYRLLQAVEVTSSAKLTSSQTPLKSTLQLFEEMQIQLFEHEWNLGPANNESVWIPLNKQKDWYIKKTQILRKLGDGAALYTKEQDYIVELAQLGIYGQLIQAAAAQAQKVGKVEERYQAYVDALVRSKEASLHKISWVNGQPRKLELQGSRERHLPKQKKCSSIPSSQCDCPFRATGVDDLEHFVCVHQPLESDEQLSTPSTPQFITGTVNLQGYILWHWGA